MKRERNIGERTKNLNSGSSGCKRQANLEEESLQLNSLPGEQTNVNNDDDSVQVNSKKVKRTQFKAAYRGKFHFRVINAHSLCRN